MNGEMELNFKEMEAEAAEQEDARSEEFRNHLEADREQEIKKNEKLQVLLNRAGERVAREKMEAMEAQVDTAIERAKAEIKSEYAQKHGVAECDDQREPLKNMLRRLMS